MSTLDFNHDYHSSANTEQVKVVHFDLNLAINFEQKKLTGFVVLHLEAQSETPYQELILDSRELNIEHIEDENAQPLSYQEQEVNEILGRKIIIALPASNKSVKIFYSTSPSAEGLQWLKPVQTSGKKLPYLFSQSQPINARSWIPLQDTPKARVTFNATIQADKGMRVVMSADNNADAKLDGEFTFKMPQPIPTHLLAIACGDLAYKELGKQTGVYTEPAMLEAVANEFEDTQQMVEMAASLLGPYRWERYDMIVLPPSFPFGGMENPRLAFMTPTLIAGDKSLVSTVAHELAHSWTGNLVSNATWRDLWLNEGFTTYFTNRIVEAIYGKEMAELEVVLEYGRLAQELETTPLENQTITANVQYDDPNTAFNRLTYDKASMFVHELHSRLGREAFDKFLFTYIEHFAFKAITTEDFVEYAKQTLLVDHSDNISERELLEWVYGTGMPSWFTPPSSNSLDKVEQARASWLSGVPAKSLVIEQWSVHHWQYFITTLPQSLTLAQLADLDECFNFTQSSNAEIAFVWFMVAVRNKYSTAYPAIEEYLGKIGRGKFVRPLYSALNTNDNQALAKRIYQQARDGYHPSIISQLDKIMAE